MKYAIIGAGGTGGTLGFYLTNAGRDVTLIARGEHLARMQQKGLTMERLWDNSTETISVKACLENDYKETPDVILSDDIRRDAMTKFSYVSPAGTAGLFCNAVAGDFQKEGEAREVFKALIREIVELSHAMGIQFQEDLVERNLKILSDLPPETTTSMQRDVLALRQSEMDGLVFEVVRMGKKYGVSMPQYEKAAEYFRENLKQ